MIDAPPPPPAPSSSAAAPANVKHPPPPELIAIADELAHSTDPLQGNALAHKALLASMKDVLTDDSLTPAQRRKELRTIAAAAKELLPDSRRWEVEQMIRADRAALEARSSEKRGAKIEAVGAPPASAKIIPLVQPIPTEPARDALGDPYPDPIPTTLEAALEARGKVE